MPATILLAYDARAHGHDARRRVLLAHRQRDFSARKVVHPLLDSGDQEHVTETWRGASCG